MEANKHKQDIAREFVNREVYANVNEMVEYILQHEDPRSPFDTTNIENLYFYPEYTGEFADFDGGAEDERDQEIYRLEELYENETDKEKEMQIYLDIDYMKYMEEEEQEIFEWWIVSPFLAKKLHEHGEPVLLDENIWGRTCSGQAIYMDGVIENICNELNLFNDER